MLEAAGVRRAKQCTGSCKAVKSPFEFSHSKNSPDGRNKYCLVCERERVKRYLPRKSATTEPGT